MSSVVYNGDGTTTVKVNACLEYTHVTSRFKILFIKLDGKIYSEIDKSLIEKLNQMIDDELDLQAALQEEEERSIGLIKKIRRLEKISWYLGLSLVGFLGLFIFLLI